MLNFSEEDIASLDLIPSSIKYAELSCGKFLIQQSCEEEILSELFFQKVAGVVGLECSKHYVYKEKNYLLTEAKMMRRIFVADDKYYNNTLDKVRFCVEYQKCKNNILINNEELMMQVYIMHFLDILFSYSERTCVSFCFNVNSDNTGTLELLKNNKILTNLDKAIRPIAFVNVNRNDYIRISKTEELSSFISILDEETKGIIKNIFNTFTPTKFLEIVSTIEKEEKMKFSCKKSMYYKYVKNYLLVGITLFMKHVISKKKIIKKGSDL